MSETVLPQPFAARLIERAIEDLREAIAERTAMRTRVAQLATEVMRLRAALKLATEAVPKDLVWEDGKMTYFDAFCTALGIIEPERFDAGIVERLAAIAHESWAGWIPWMIAKWDEILPNGETFRDRWLRQAATPYANLSEVEKESDRIEARKYLAALGGA